MTSSSRVSCVKRNLFGRTIYPPSFVDVASIILEKRRGEYLYNYTSRLGNVSILMKNVKITRFGTFLKVKKKVDWVMSCIYMKY